MATNMEYAGLTSREHASRQSVVVIPTGAVEQHGPHLPIGADIWLATAVAKAVAQDRPAVLVAEPFPYGCSEHHMSFSGTISLEPQTYIGVVKDVVRSVTRHGDVPVFVNGHGGNRSPLGTALQELLSDGVQAWALSYFESLADAVTELFDRPETAVGHACAVETSLIQHLWPEYVHQAEIPKVGTPESWPAPFLFSGELAQTARPFDALDSRGIVGEPGLASGEAGAQLFATAVHRVGDAIDRIAEVTNVGASAST